MGLTDDTGTCCSAHHRWSRLSTANMEKQTKTQANTDTALPSHLQRWQDTRALFGRGQPAASTTPMQRALFCRMPLTLHERPSCSCAYVYGAVGRWTGSELSALPSYGQPMGSRAAGSA